MSRLSTGFGTSRERRQRNRRIGESPFTFLAVPVWQLHGRLQVVIDPDGSKEPVRPAFEDGDSRLGRKVVGAPAEAVVFQGAPVAVVGHLALLERETSPSAEAFEEVRVESVAPSVQSMGANGFPKIPVRLECLHDPVRISSAKGSQVTADDIAGLVRSGSQMGGRTRRRPSTGHVLQ